VDSGGSKPRQDQSPHDRREDSAAPHEGHDELRDDALDAESCDDEPSESKTFTFELRVEGPFDVDVTVDVGTWPLSEESEATAEPAPDGFLYLPKSLELPIPTELHSVYEEGPFTTCTACGGKLRGRSDEPADGTGADGTGADGTGADGDARLYEIQKVYRGSEVIFETAICHPCGERLAGEVSRESLDAMKGFLLCNFKPSADLWHCHFCGMPRQLFRNYNLVGVCRDGSLLLPSIVMCEKCGEGLNGRLSQKTKDVQGDFIQDNFPGVPADLDLYPSLPGLV